MQIEDEVTSEVVDKPLGHDSWPVDRLLRRSEVEFRTGLSRSSIDRANGNMRDRQGTSGAARVGGLCRQQLVFGIVGNSREPRVQFRTGYNSTAHILCRTTVSWMRLPRWLNRFQPSEIKSP